MKVIYHVILILFITVVIAQKIEPEITMERKKLIILANDKQNSQISQKITQIASSTATQLNRYDIIDRNQLDKILKEQKLQHSGIVNLDQAVEIGKVSGANEALLISITNFGQKGVPTEDQKKKMEAIQQARTEEMRKLREGGAGGDRQARLAKYKELFEKYQKQTNAVLTEEQKKKMAEARAQGGRGQGRRGNSLASLNLTEEQKKKVSALQAKQRTERIDLYRKESGNREALGEKMTAMREKHSKQVEALLTDEQKKKYKELQAQRPQSRPGGGSTRPGGGRPPRPEGKGKERPKRSDA